MPLVVTTPAGDLVMAKRRILGLDTSLTSTGWALVDSCGQHTVGIVKPPPATADIGHRLSDIRKAIRNVAGLADLAIVERAFVARNGLTPGMVFGVALAELWDAGVPVVQVPPLSMKVFAAGRGTTEPGQSKTAVYGAAVRRLGYAGNDHNEADALWLAHLGWHLIGHPKADLPKDNVRALSGPWAEGWPAGPPSKPTTKRRTRKDT